MGGLEECGYEVIVCRADAFYRAYLVLRLYFRATRQPEEGWFVAPEMMKLREVSARMRRLRLPAVNGWVVLGSENGLPIRGPFVTLDDLTVAEAQNHRWYFASYPPRTWAHWNSNQEKLYRGATRCFAASSWAAASIARDYKIPADKIEVVGFGRNVEAPPPANRDWSVPRFLFVGADWERKNGPAVLEAFTGVRQRFPSAELAVVGNHPALDTPGVQGFGRLRHFQPDERETLMKLLERSTCLVVPSFLEPFGIIYAEAAAAGLAIIGTTVGGALDAVGPAGECVDPSDREALVRAMLRMADPEVASAYGSAGPRYAERYTWATVAARIAAALPAGEGA